MKKLNILIGNKNDWFLINISIFYLLFPIILFAFGWMKPGYAIVFSLLVTYSAIKASQQFEYSSFSFSKKNLILISVLILIAILWVLLSGIGGFGLQSWDFHGRNAILHDLISHPWPVRYDYTNQPEMATLIGEQGRLIYYFSFFLPAALFGKFFGWFGANLFLYCWTVLGIMITFLLIFRFFKRISVWIALAFIFFSGMDFLASVGNFNTYSSEGFSSIFTTNQLEWWAGNIFQYSSITTQLFNVFNQCIPAWIITLIIIQLRNLKSIWFFYSLLFLFGPFPFVGLFPFVLFKIIQLTREKNTRNPTQKRIRFDFFNKFSDNKPDWFNFQNTIGGTIIFFVSSMFLLSNAGNHEFGFIWQFQKNPGPLVFIYVTFCALEFLLLGFFLIPLSKDKKLLWITLGILIAFPLLKYGKMNDFVMRASIPALLILFLITIQSLSSNQKTNFKIPISIFRIIIVVVLLIGSITAFHELNRSANAILQYSGKPLVMDEWKSFDYGGYIDKMETVKNFIVTDYSKIATLFFKN
ncbi:MAG: hypothetical protein ACYDH1_10810 [Anaerolineaceae bacterium]